VACLFHITIIIYNYVCSLYLVWDVLHICPISNKAKGKNTKHYKISLHKNNYNICRSADKSLAFPSSPTFIPTKFIVLYLSDLNFIIVA
jgi:hypothetical protein